jgi:hypothetical protein
MRGGHVPVRRGSTQNMAALGALAQPLFKLFLESKCLELLPESIPPVRPPPSP